MNLRPIRDTDREFLRDLYRSTREEEMLQTPWTEAEKAQFIEFQFSAQHEHYMEHYPAAQFDVVETNEGAVGRLYVDRRKDEIRLIDIALLPEFRNQGIGGRLLNGLIDESERSGKPLSIHVEQMNPAMRLYKRLGFEKISEYGIYHLMQRPCAESSNA